MKSMKVAFMALVLAAFIPSSSFAAFCSATCHINYDIKGRPVFTDYVAKGQGGDIEQAYMYLVLDCENATKRATITAQSKYTPDYKLITSQKDSTGGHEGFWGTDSKSRTEGFDVRSACVSGNNFAQ